ncbi:MAG: MBL fold metallo-hydrolase [Anaerovoracaceae bacterium]
MGLTFTSFGSGSSGNSYLVKSNKTALIIDTGISGKRIFEGVQSSGLEEKDINAILITHDHIDHIRSIRIVSKRFHNAKVFAASSVIRDFQGKLPKEGGEVICHGDEIQLGDITVRVFHCHHDSEESISFSFQKEGKKVAIITDTGHICQDILNEIDGADILVIEANYDAKMLAGGSYPKFLQKRISGDYGHLSNEQTAETILRLEQRPKKLILAHLSKENNNPVIAEKTIANSLSLAETELYVLERDLASKEFKVK